jgi:hypothetical protein
VRVLAYFIKHWAKRRGINSPSDGTLSSYGYILMLIYYLQQRGLVPNLQRIPQGWEQQDAFGAGFVEAGEGDAYDFSYGDSGSGESLSKKPQSLPVRLALSADNLECDTYFYSPKDGGKKLRAFGAQNAECVFDLLLGFFHFYTSSSFDYARHVVSVRTGGLQPSQQQGGGGGGGGGGSGGKKGGKQQTSKSPRPFFITKDEKVRECGKTPEGYDRWRAHRRLSIEDPFEVGYDVGHVLKEVRRVWCPYAHTVHWGLLFLLLHPSVPLKALRISHSLSPPPFIAGQASPHPQGVRTCVHVPL